MTPTLEKIKNFAASAHGDQRRKYSSEPYIRHPLRVMHLCGEFGADESMMAAALLHDVLEDTPVTEAQMKEFLQTLFEKQKAQKILQLVIELTDVYTKKRYPSWNRRKRKQKEAERISATSAESQTIKYADILDNTHEIADADPDFAKVFFNECFHLVKNMSKGHPELRSITIMRLKEKQALLRSVKSPGKN